MRPIILVNFKTYKEGTGKNALKLAKIIEDISKNYEAEFIIAVQATDIKQIKDNVSIKVFAQNFEIAEQGKSTGYITAESLKEAGASGNLLNHSEYRLSNETIKQIIKKSNSLKLTTVVCANDVPRAVEISQFKPDFIAVEPPELIGGKISVAEAKPEIIEDAVKAIKTNVLVGAGINKAEDLRVSLKLGAKGILLSSAIVTAKDPKKALSDLLEGL